MATSPSNVPLLNHSGTLQPTKGHVNVRFQAGLEVLPEDMNDAQDILHQEVARFREEFGFSSSARHPGEFAFVPVSFEGDVAQPKGVHARNKDNFALTLGRLHTPFGLIDPAKDRQPATFDGGGLHQPPTMADYLIYDWLRIAGFEGVAASGDGDVSRSYDRPYGNRLFVGTVTASGAGETAILVDENKRWSAAHRLLGLDTTASTEGLSVALSLLYRSLGTQRSVQFKEPACRIVFTTGANAGVVRTITGLTDEVTLAFAALPAALSEGDEYVIVPGNALKQGRDLYDAQTAVQSAVDGVTHGWRQLVYVQSWLEDISADEDESLIQPDFQAEITHRTELRWCIRVVNYRHDYAEPSTALSKLVALGQRVTMSGDGNAPYAATGTPASFNAQELGASQITGGGDATIWTNADMSAGHVGYAKPSAEGRWSALGIGMLSLTAGVGSLKSEPSGALDGFGAYERSGLRDSFDTARLALQLVFDALVSDVSITGICTFFAEAKSVDGDTLTPYVFPAESASQLPSSKRVRFSFSRYYEPACQFLSLADASAEIVQGHRAGYHLATARQWNHGLLPDGDDPAYIGSLPAGALYTSETHDLDGPPYTVSLRVPLQFASIGQHLAHLDALVLGKSGLLSAARLSDGSEPPGSLLQRVVYDSLLPERDTLIGSAGQQPSFVRETFSGSAPEEINPAHATEWIGFGTVKMIDPLTSGADGFGESQIPLNADNESDPRSQVAFVKGPGKYFLRDGTEITPSHRHGWGFYRHGNQRALDGKHRMDLTPRLFHEGIAQAASMRESLNFRKLAIKTVATKSMDMWNYWMGRPDLLRGSGNVMQSGAYTLDSTGYMGVGAIQNPHPQQHGDLDYLPKLARQNRTSYHGFTRPTALPGATWRSPWHAAGLRPKDVNSGEVASDRVNGIVRDKGSRAAEFVPSSPDADLVWMNASAGPWGRYAIADGDTTSPDDLWTNRCTSMRLRYHVGDFYPGATGEGGGPQNALVDTLKLFVRIEPLSLVHWATMPRHQHTILEDSLSFQDALQDFMRWVRGYGLTTHLLDVDGRPRITTGSPEYTGVNEGVVDTRSMPIANMHQPFVHWYHPLMEAITAPHPSGEEYPTNVAWNTVSGDKKVMYKKWGERSLIIPAIVYEDNLAVTGYPATPVGGTLGDPGTEGAPGPSYGPADGGEVGDLVYNRFAADPDLIPNTTAAWDDDLLGSHKTHDFDDGGEVSKTITVEGETVATHSYRKGFPFVPSLPDVMGYDQGGGNITDLLHAGSPGPVFLPAYRRYVSGHGGTPTRRFGFHEAMHVKFSLLSSGTQDEYKYVPHKDGVHGAAATPDGTELFTDGGPDNGVFNRGLRGNDLPILRAALRTDTVAAVVDLIRTTFEFKRSGDNLDLPTYPTQTSVRQPGSGSDVPTDSLFVGDLGMSVAMQGRFHSDGTIDSPDIRRPFFLHPMVLSAPMAKSTHRDDDSIADNPNAPASLAEATAYDAFDACYLERIVAQTACETANPGDGAKFVPLIEMYRATRLMGLQQKLLWNCSFRVLHVRPGGGRNTPHNAPVKSLTELFILRNALFGGTPTVLPSGVALEQKPFLHLESMHPSSDGHPNFDKLAHLYPMVVDSMGGPVSGTNGSLNSPPTGTSAAHDVSARPDITDFQNSPGTWASGLNGDTVGCDPFDTAYADDNPGFAQPARGDRFRHNSGIEVDLVSELRAIRKRAADFGLDQNAIGAKTWLELMPTVEDLSAPGDHEIVFVLYTGRFGHRMFDDSTPRGFNPPFCGCHLHAALEVNRPSETRPSSYRGLAYAASDEGLRGQHYGQTEVPGATGSEYGRDGYETNHIP